MIELEGPPVAGITLDGVLYPYASYEWNGPTAEVVLSLYYYWWAKYNMGSMDNGAEAVVVWRTRPTWEIVSEPANPNRAYKLRCRVAKVPAYLLSKVPK